MKKSSQNSLHDQKIFPIYGHKNNSNDQKIVKMKHLIVQMRKKVKFKWSKTYNSYEQKNHIQINQKDSSNEQLFFSDHLNHICSFKLMFFFLIWIIIWLIWTIFVSWNIFIGSVLCSMRFLYPPNPPLLLILYMP